VEINNFFGANPATGATMSGLPDILRIPEGREKSKLAFRESSKVQTRKHACTRRVRENGFLGAFFRRFRDWFCTFEDPLGDVTYSKIFENFGPCDA
jgi:hypothetical protein